MRITYIKRYETLLICFLLHLIRHFKFISLFLHTNSNQIHIFLSIYMWLILNTKYFQLSVHKNRSQASQMTPHTKRKISTKQEFIRRTIITQQIKRQSNFVNDLVDKKQFFTVIDFYVFYVKWIKMSFLSSMFGSFRKILDTKKKADDNNEGNSKRSLVEATAKKQTFLSPCVSFKPPSSKKRSKSLMDYSSMKVWKFVEIAYGPDKFQLRSFHLSPISLISFF